jgi:hypothetical protein
VTRTIEVEHKYLLEPEFDFAAWSALMASLAPVRHNHILVTDRYYLLEGGLPGRFVLRHRSDAELHQLTLKSFGQGVEVRDEISLDLAGGPGSQDEVLGAFMARMGLVWTGALVKELDVWYFPDCEIVHYQATAGQVNVRCIEFEATDVSSIAAALETIASYERLTGFAGRRRTDQSLLELLFPEARTWLE